MIEPVGVGTLRAAPVSLPLSSGITRPIAFIILMYTGKDECYYIPFRDIEKFSERAKNGGRKSFRYDEVDKSYLIKQTGGVPLHFLEQLQMDLSSR